MRLRVALGILESGQASPSAFPDASWWLPEYRSRVASIKFESVKSFNPLCNSFEAGNLLF